MQVGRSRSQTGVGSNVTKAGFSVLVLQMSPCWMRTRTCQVDCHPDTPKASLFEEKVQGRKQKEFLLSRQEKRPPGRMEIGEGGYRRRWGGVDIQNTAHEILNELIKCCFKKETRYSGAGF